MLNFHYQSSFYFFNSIIGFKNVWYGLLGNVVHILGNLIETHSFSRLFLFPLVLALTWGRCLIYFQITLESFCILTYNTRDHTAWICYHQLAYLLDVLHIFFCTFLSGLSRGWLVRRLIPPYFYFWNRHSWNLNRWF